MKRDPADALPVVGSASSAELGARVGIDIAVDPVGNVVLNSGGMSVAPGWRDLPITRIPGRLRHLAPGAAGANSTSCFTIGSGPFQQGTLAAGLELIPDQGQVPAIHGVIAPLKVVPLGVYQSDLGNTRGSWKVDET